MADKVGAAPVHRTEQEGDVVFIDGIVAEVVEFDFHNLGKEGDVAQKIKDGGGLDPALAQFDGIFRGDVFRNEESEFAAEPAFDDFAVGARGAWARCKTGP